MNSPNLLLHIDILHHVQSPIPLLWGHTIITRSSLLPSRKFLFRDHGLTGNAVEEITALTGKPLEVVGDVLGGEVCCGIAAVGFGLLFFPARIEEFDCEVR